MLFIFEISAWNVEGHIRKNILLVKAWTAIDRLSIIWNSNLSKKNKTQFLPSSSHINSTIWMHHMDTD